MAISDKTRKILWGKSGNRCAICRQELVLDANHKDDSSIIGEECHIVARELNGARGNSDLSAKQRDEYDNLILLCRIHHKQIDDQPNMYEVAILKAIKIFHETWVQQALNPKTPRSSSQPFLVFRVDTGKQFVGLLGQAEASRFDNDELTEHDHIDLVANFFQKISEYIDIWDEMEPRDKILTQVEFEKEIRTLQSIGFVVYACITTELFGDKSNPLYFRVMNALAFRVTNPIILRKDEGLEAVMKERGQRESKYTNFVMVRQG